MKKRSRKYQTKKQKMLRDRECKKVGSVLEKRKKNSKLTKAKQQTYLGNRSNQTLERTDMQQNSHTNIRKTKATTKK